MTNVDYLKLPYIEVTQPIGSFYLTKMTWSDLLSIAEADIRRIEQENQQTASLDTYLGIQREVNKSRVKEIGEYVRTFDATFPTSIILAIQSETVMNDTEEVRLSDYETLSKDPKLEDRQNIFFSDGFLHVRRSKGIANILDGQHRLEGLRSGFTDSLEFNDNAKNFELNVTIFLDIDVDYQAQIFSVINKAQTKVNKSLVYDLYDYAKSRSPQKTAHDIVRVLNRMEDSPFFRRIKILGKATDKGNETIAQATFVELIIGYISTDPMMDRHLLKNKSKLPSTTSDKKLVFRRFFAVQKDEVILNILWNFFTAVAQRWPESWNNITRGNILNKSTGIIALMRLLRDFINIDNFDAGYEVSWYRGILDVIAIADGTFTTDKYIPGSSGQSFLYKEMRRFIPSE